MNRRSSLLWSPVIVTLRNASLWRPAQRRTKAVDRTGASQWVTGALSRHNSSHQLAISRTNRYLVVVSRRCRLSDLPGIGFPYLQEGFSWMRDMFFYFEWALLGRGGPSFGSLRSRLAQVGKSAGQQLASPVDLPTTVAPSWLAAPAAYYSD